MKAMDSGSSVFFIQKQRRSQAVEDEEHALVLRHLAAEHQAGLRLQRRARHLGADVVHAGAAA